ncbi:hypothetical protein J6590_035234 [Homalodisca vitripennis]|nr:hypothetical protein J6590_035234 [Homalodisca vitripennis]
MYAATDCRVWRRDVPDLDEDEDVDEDMEDDGRVYKNPRNSPSALCPRDEEHAAFLIL